ncbi:MAG: hypothetical protein HWD61_10765 [Parachlamydiaceae bacterium]|nr:MAG: hypothetical protein HWD61_10765 [Parachlamydiaceae bacterium]
MHRSFCPSSKKITVVTVEEKETKLKHAEEAREKLLAPHSKEVSENSNPSKSNDAEQLSNEAGAKDSNGEKAAKSSLFDLVNLAQPLTQKEFNQRFIETPFESLYIRRNSLLKEYIWVADFLKNHPYIKLILKDDQENLSINFNEEIEAAIEIYVTKSQKFADFVFNSCVAALHEAPFHQDLTNFFLKVVTCWAQAVNFETLEDSPALSKNLLFALSLAKGPMHDDLFEKLSGFIFHQNQTEQLGAYINSCKTSPLLAKLFLENLTHEQLESIKQQFELPCDATLNREDYLIREFYSLLEKSKICTNESWSYQKSILEKLIKAFPDFTKERVALYPPVKGGWIF